MDDRVPVIVRAVALASTVAACGTQALAVPSAVDSEISGTSEARRDTAASEPPPIVIAPAAPSPLVVREDPAPLPEGDEVRVVDLVAALERVATRLEDEPAVQADYAAWVERHGLVAGDRLWRDYVRVRLVFECVRDGGLWQIRWAITNRSPNSDEIWSQWAKLDGFDPAQESVTATAECDELSALFAHLVRRLGVDDVGLFWPTWNHVVAVWTVEGQRGPVRVVVPTSQIFLERDASLGTDGFNPWKQKTIYEYRRRDVRDEVRLPGELVRFFIARAWTELRRGQRELQAERNARSDRLGGS